MITRAATSILVLLVAASAAGAQMQTFEGRAPATLVQRALACTGGDRAACREVLRRYHAHEDLPQDPVVLRQFLAQLCEELDYVPHSASAAEMRAIDRRAQPCFRELFALESAQCSAGDASVCLEVVGLHQTGHGTPRSDGRARELLQRVCEGDDVAALPRALACDQLGELYESAGHGVRPDPARALALHERACAADASSCERLGALYERGVLGPVDLGLARARYQRACDANVRHACDALASLGAGPP